MAQAVETNGAPEVEGVSLSRVGRPPKGEETFPKGSSIAIDQAHRQQVERWISWYYPSGKANLADVVQEMMDVAYALAEDDSQRAETAVQRTERFKKRGQS